MSELDCDDNLIVVSRSGPPVTTPGALTRSICVKKNITYYLEIRDKKITCESKPILYIVDGLNN